MSVDNRTSNHGVGASLAEKVRVVELLPGRYFKTWHRPECVIFRMPLERPWCDCGGYERTMAIEEVEAPHD